MKGVETLRATKNEKEKTPWYELCEYVKSEILEYDANQMFPKYLALKLQGLKKGQHIANNYCEKNANYDDYTLLCTFKLCKKRIVDYLHSNDKRIKDEKHKINLIIKMIEPEINDVYMRLQRAEKVKSKVEQESFENQGNTNAGYVTKTKEVNDKLKNLF